jgi:micrococcal nuclease
MSSRFRQFLAVRRRGQRMLPPAWRRRPLLAVAALVAATACLLAHRLGGSNEPGDDCTRYHLGRFRVARVVDGDTVDLDARDGAHPRTRVRLWGVDTPEVAASGRGEMHFGTEASAFARSLLEGHEVTVHLLKGRTRDRYGRLLAYLTLPGDDKTFNERLIETGHGYADWRFDHPFKESFLNAERQARKRGDGLWAKVRTDEMPAWRRSLPKSAAERSARPRS